MTKVLVSNVKGPKGDKGEKGDQGIPGTNGLPGPAGPNSVPTREFMAAEAADESSPFRAELSRAIAESARVPQTLVVIGDSLTEQGGMVAGSPHRNTTSFWPWGLNLLGQRLELLGNLGIGGEVTGSIAARIQGAIALNPGWVHILAGTNDIGTAKTLAYSIGNLTAMYDAVQGEGIRLAVGTIPPRNGMTQAQKDATAALNGWVRDEATRRGLVLIDYEAALTDIATSGYPSAPSTAQWTSDGIHMKSWAGFATGRAFANAMRPHLTAGSPLSSVPGQVNLLGPVGARFALGDGSLANGWGRNNYSAIPAGSTPARTDDVYGTWRQQIVATGDVCDMFVNVPLGPALAVGDRVEFLFEYEVLNLDPAPAADSAWFTARTACYIGGTFPGEHMRYDLWASQGIENGPIASRSGVFRTPPLTVAAGTDLVQALIQMKGGGTYRFGRALLRKV